MDISRVNPGHLLVIPKAMLRIFLS